MVMVNQSITQLELDFDKEAREFYRIAKRKCPRLTSRILEMFDRHSGAHRAVKVLLYNNVQNGFVLMWEADPTGLGMMRYTLEAQVLNPKYKPLFDDKDRETARSRLLAYNFDVDGYVKSLSAEAAPMGGEIRLIPMSPTEFGDDSISQVQAHYFQQKLPYIDNYRYGYAERGIDCGYGALLLFQLRNSVIASALFEGIDKDNHDILLLSGSITVFEPITKDELSDADRSFRCFTQAKQRLDPRCKDTLMKLIEDRKYYLNPQDCGEFPQPTNTECEQIVKARIGQAGFRNELLNQDGQCRICGIDLQAILRASHIKPWKDSNNKERLDKFNGLLLCPTHDALFDEGYISFDDGGSIIISRLIDKALYGVLGIGDSTKINVHPQNAKYLKWHRAHMKS